MATCGWCLTKDHDPCPRNGTGWSCDCPDPSHPKPTKEPASEHPAPPQ